MERRLDPLFALLEQSLEVVCLESGSDRAMVRQDYASMPFTLVGQSVEGPLWIEPEGAKAVCLPAGGGYILPEDTRYRLDPKDHRDRLYHWGHFRLRVLGELDLFHLVRSPLVVGREIGARLGSLNVRIAATVEASRGPMMSRVTERRRLGAEMLSLIVSVSPPQPGVIDTIASLARLAPVFRFMREQMARPIFRDELARIAGLSPSRFHAVFVTTTGQSPMQYLARLRLRHAQGLLLATKRPVNEIGEAVGFRDAFHFSRTFKQFNGVSPRAYRRRGGEFLLADP